MKILIVSQYYWPEQFQINEIAPELVKRGHEVTVLCGVPNYPKGVVFDGYCDRTRCYIGRWCCCFSQASHSKGQEREGATKTSCLR